MNTFHLLVKRSMVNIPLPHFSRTHYFIIPVFQSRLGGMSEANSLELLFYVLPVGPFLGIYISSKFTKKASERTWQNER
jgi:hypothetical protein